MCNVKCGAIHFTDFVYDEVQSLNFSAKFGLRVQDRRHRGELHSVKLQVVAYNW